MKVSVLLDSSFLISLVDSSRKNHKFAKQYYKQMLQVEAAIYLSTIVISEISVKQKIADFPLANFRILPFNIRHGIEAGKLWNFVDINERGVRHVVKDDVKLIAQASLENIDVILTDDERTFYRHCEQLRRAGHTRTRAIKLVDGFDDSVLTLNGQRGLNWGEFGIAEAQADSTANKVVPISRSSPKLEDISRSASENN